MFDSSTGLAPQPTAPASLNVATVEAWREQLLHLDPAGEAECVDLLTALEGLTAAAAGAQAQLAVDLDTSVRERHANAGIPAARQGRGVGSMVALARRVSPHRGSRLLGLAKILAAEMPHTYAALRAGRTSEWRATLLVRETGHLTREHRTLVDEQLMADPRTLDGVGDGQLVAKVKEAACALDPEAAVRRASKAERDRRVTLRPAPDTMSQLNALLPVTGGVAVFAALKAAADQARAQGDPRSRGQVMADTLVERVTGRSAATPADLEVQVVISDRTLLGAGRDPAHVAGFGPVPPRWARQLIARTLAARGPTTREGPPAAATPTDRGGGPTGDGGRVRRAAVTLRRLWAAPRTGTLVAMESRARRFPDGLALWIDVRDQVCRTPWCDAPVRHHDHARGHDAGGPTSSDNGQGLCEACNYAKQAPGWRARPTPGDRHTVTTTTPTGHVYSSTAPPLVGTGPGRTTGDGSSRSRLEVHFAEWVLGA